MPKSTKNHLNEVEIIKRRDGVAEKIVAEQLDAESRRELADARLRALAFALGAHKGDPTGAEDVQDTELLAYLLDILPEGRRLELENALRGDARVFDRLITLRSALNTPMDERDRHWADHPLRKIPRHIARTLEVRSVGQQLQFRDASVAGGFVTNLISPGKPPRSQKQPVSKAALMREPSVAQMPSRRQDRSTELLMTGRNLIDNACMLLAQWEKLHFDEGAEQTQQHRSDDVRERVNEIRRHLDALLFRLERAPDQLPGDSQLEQLIASFNTSQFDYTHAKSLGLEYAPADADLEDWTATMDIQVGPWSVRLEGTNLASSTLAVTVRSRDTQGSCELPLLTLVRSKNGFETKNVDSSGLAKLPLSEGQSTLLVQAEKEVWEVRLTVRLA